MSWFLRLHPLLNERWQHPIGHAVDHGLTVSVDLTRSAEQHWAETSSGHRSDINRARRAGVEVHRDPEFRQLESFVKLYGATMDRIEATSYYHFDDAYFTRLTGGLGRNLHLWIASEGDQIIGGSMFTICPTTGLIGYHLSASHGAYRHRQPAKVILDEVRSWGREAHFQRLHLGGGLGAGDDSLFRFKRRFGSGVHPFQTVRIVLDPIEYDALSGRDGRHHDLGDFFPAYRSPDIER